MKVAAVMAVLAFVAVQAAAVPEADAKIYKLKGKHGFCGVPGQACGKARDAAPEPFAAPEADAEAKVYKVKGKKVYKLKGLHGFCGLPGSPCGKARDAEAKIRKLKGKHGFCGVPGQACGKVRDADAKIYKLKGKHGFCGVPGQACGRVKRAANAIADAVADADADAKIRKLKGKHGFCGVPGQACGKARDLIDTITDQTNEIYGALYEREAHALADANPDALAKIYKLKGKHGFCGVPGQACGRVRSDEAVAEAYQKVDKRDPKIRKLKGKHGFCGVPGQACGKARNAEAIAAAINEADPDYLKNECFAEGGECNTLLKIQAAFHEAQAASDKAATIQDPIKQLAQCSDKHECTPMTAQHAFNKRDAPELAAQEEEECHGPDGECTLFARDLVGLEETIDDAVAQITGIGAEEDADEE